MEVEVATRVSLGAVEHLDYPNNTLIRILIRSDYPNNTLIDYPNNTLID